MFDIGWPEFLVILVVALIIIGPRDLPGALRQVGRWVRSARKVAREFQRHVDDAMRDTELEDLKKGIEATRSLNVKRQLEKFVDPDDELSASDSPGAARKAAARQKAAAAAGEGIAGETAPPALDKPGAEPAAPLDPNDPRRRAARAAAMRSDRSESADTAGEAAADADAGATADAAAPVAEGGDGRA